MGYHHVVKLIEVHYAYNKREEAHQDPGQTTYVWQEIKAIVAGSLKLCDAQVTLYGHTYPNVVLLLVGKRWKLL